MVTSGSHFVVVTGGAGVGKTTLIAELSQRGYAFIPEIARKIIKEQVASNGNALPWGNRELYCSLMLARSIDVESKIRAVSKPGDIVFVDRGVPDILAYVHMIGLVPSEALLNAVTEFSYFRKVFILPPWREIYLTDSERKQNFAEVISADKSLRKTYLDLGYEVIEVPPLSVYDRANFVLSHLDS